MSLITQSYNIDLVPNGSPLVVNVSQFDKGSRTLEFHLFKDNVAYTVETGVSANISGMKPDGTGFMYAMTVDGTVASVEITQQMTAVAGNCPCEIRLVDGSGDILGTMNFTLAVEKAALDDDSVISESDIPVFEELVIQAQEAASEAAQSASDAEDAASEVASLLPASGTAGQYLQKTASGTQWANVDTLPSGGTTGQVLTKISATDGDAHWQDAAAATLTVTFTYANSAYSADKTYAEIMANVNAGGVPIGVYGGTVMQLVSYTSGMVSFGYRYTSGEVRLNISSADAVTSSATVITPTYYATVGLGSSTAVSDSTVYTNGYKLTLRNSNIQSTSIGNVVFPNDDYVGNVTWSTYAGYVELFFDADPNSKTLRFEWSVGYGQAVTVG